MRVKMKTLAAGPEGVTKPGKVRNCSAEEAKQLIDAGYAVPYVSHDVETAARRTRKPKDESGSDE